MFSIIWTLKLARSIVLRTVENWSPLLPYDHHAHQTTTETRGVPCGVVTLEYSSIIRTETAEHVVTLTAVVGFGIYLCAKGLNGCKPRQDHSLETALTEAFTVGNKHLGEWISFHAWHTCSQPLVQNRVNDDSSNHPGFFLPSKPLLLFLHNLRRKKRSFRL